ncbi:electron transfer flavoprotein subunit beta/FixA family protein [Chloroflexota bacterium]
MIRVIVCVKQVIDPEAPVSLFQVDTENNRIIQPKGTPPVLNPFDENALEAALKIKDAQDTMITVLSLGRNLARPVLKKSLAAGADELILLEDETFEDLDSYSAAHVLAHAIKKIGQYDLILCGREAADTDAGLVGSGIAEILGIPSITLAGKIEVNDWKIKVDRVMADGYEVIEAPMPALITVSNEIGELRYPVLKDIMAVQKKEVTVWKAHELQVTAGGQKRANLYRLFQPVSEGECEIIEAESSEEAAVNLAQRLREFKII